MLTEPTDGDTELRWTPVSVGAGDTQREGRGLGVVAGGRMLSAGDTLWYDEMLSEMVLTSSASKVLFYR